MRWPSFSSSLCPPLSPKSPCCLSLRESLCKCVPRGPHSGDFSSHCQLQSLTGQTYSVCPRDQCSATSRTGVPKRPWTGSTSSASLEMPIAGPTQTDRIRNSGNEASSVGVAITKCHRLGSVQTTDVRDQSASRAGEGLSLADFSLHPHARGGREGGGAMWGPCISSLITLRRAPT